MTNNGVNILGNWAIYHHDGGVEKGPDYIQINSNVAGQFLCGVTYNIQPSITVTLSGNNINLSWYSKEYNENTYLSGTVSGSTMSGTFVESGYSNTWRGVKVTSYSCP